MSNGDRNEFYIVNQYLPLLLQGTVSNEGERQSRKLVLLTQGDGTLRDWGVLVGLDDAGRERPVAVEATRELAESMHGEDPSGDIVGLRTDEQRLLRNRPYEPYRTGAAAALTAAWTDYYTCPANSIAKAYVRIGYNPGTWAGMQYVSLRARGVPIGQFPIYQYSIGPACWFVLAATETISARTDGTGATIHVAVELYSTGDMNTGV